jgi:hypothetical protein
MYLKLLNYLIKFLPTNLLSTKNLDNNNTIIFRLNFFFHSKINLFQAWTSKGQGLWARLLQMVKMNSNC